MKHKGYLSSSWMGTLKHPFMLNPTQAQLLHSLFHLCCDWCLTSGSVERLLGVYGMLGNLGFWLQAPTASERTMESQDSLDTYPVTKAHFCFYNSCFFVPKCWLSCFVGILTESTVFRELTWANSAFPFHSSSAHHV